MIVEIIRETEDNKWICEVRSNTRAILIDTIIVDSYPNDEAKSQIIEFYINKVKSVINN